MATDIIKIPSKDKCDKPQEVTINNSIIDSVVLVPESDDEVFDI